MRARKLLSMSLLALIGLLPVPAPAASIELSELFTVNLSSPGEALDGGTRLREWRTASLIAPAPPDDGPARFTSRFAWLAAQRILSGGGIILPSHARNVGYELHFRVEDPLARGYSLVIDATLRGYLTARLHDNEGGFTPFVFAAGTTLIATLDSGEGFGPPIEAISPLGDVVTARPEHPFGNLLVEAHGRHDAGRFAGTRDFVLRFAADTANAAASMQNLTIGEAAVRFGLGPTLPGFADAGYPGPDGEAASAHGHFVTVTAHAVPLPPAAWLFAGALVPLAARLRRRRLPLAGPVR